MKKLWIALATLLATVGVMTLHPQKADAASYGNLGEYTTPVELRGTWYYRQVDPMTNKLSKKIYKLRVLAHTIEDANEFGYVYVNDENSVGDFLKMTSEEQKQAEYATKGWVRGQRVMHDGINYLNIKGWFQSSGSGEYYGFTMKKKNGKMVPAVRIAHGAGFWVTGYAYRSKDLA